VLPVCGDFIISAGEQCDDGNNNDADFCRNTCIIPRCGDGVVSTGIGEQCDDTNTNSNDGCNSGCITEFCGDGVVQTGIGEECDDANAIETDTCHTDCNVPVCGDNIADPGQFCFDSAVTNVIAQDLTSTNNSGELLFLNLNARGVPDFLLTAPGTADLVSGLGLETAFNSIASINTFEVTQMVSGDFDPGVAFQVGLNSNGLITLGASTNVNGASALAVGEINNDGDLDLIVTSTATDNAVLFLGANGAQFTATATTVPLGTGADPVDVKLADMNNDGELDIIAANNGTDRFAVALSNGAGFNTPTFKTGTSNIIELVIEDFNGDGLLDVASVDELFVQINKQNANGTFTLTGIANVGILSTSIEAADLDADGDIDLIVNNSATGVVNDIFLFFNNGNGSIPATPSSTLNAGNLAGDLAIADLNNDGVSDIGVVNRGSNSISVFRSNP
jgi:cysteine-rich repeat protein